MITTRAGRRVPPRPGLVGPLPRRVLRLVVAGLLVGLWFTHLAPRSLGGPMSLIWVSGFSMEPTLHTGDLAILHRSSRYEVGDIVAFDIPEGGTVIHRVIERSADGYRFQGDNRDMVDPWVLGEEAIRGRQVLAIPGAASSMAWLRQPTVLAGLVAAMVVVARLPSGRPVRR